ncbi:MAG: winged helix-turn-helix domain-containing protein [Sphingomicrobium sp.]
MTEATKVMVDRALVTPAMLTAMDDFTLGAATISPARRTIGGPGGEISVEPRVMQVLVCLAEAAGRVVGREELFERCWGGVFVGDDSLNRAIAGIRRVAEDVAAGSFAIETVPRAGYRLTGATPAAVRTEPGSESALAGRRFSRRAVTGVALAASAVGGVGLWSALQTRADVRFDELMKRGRRMVGDSSPGEASSAASLFEDAVAMRPESAPAWGLLALSRSALAQASTPAQSARIVAAAETAARKALAIDQREPNALLAMFILEGSTLGWLARDRKLRQIIAIDRSNVPAISELVGLLQSTGLTRESWSWNERAVALEPLSLEPLGRRALKLWIMGRVAEADRVIDQVRDLYPQNTFAWWVRFLILAMSGRPLAALAMLDETAAMHRPPTEIALWRPTLAALDQPSAGNIAAARSACLDAATKAGLLAAEAVMILARLGQVDAAFDAANGFLLSRGAIVRRGEHAPRVLGTDASWRMSIQWLFTPPAAALRADARFLPLCAEIGLADYWQARGLKPDYLHG